MTDVYDLILAARAGDKTACEEIVKGNSGLIWSVAKRYFGRGVDPDDLYQLGCVGFLKAVQGFSFEYGTQFSTYAVPKIAGEIRRFLRDDGNIKVSRSIKEKAMHIKMARAKLEQRLCREPTLSEITAETGIEAEEIAMCETAAAGAESLQKETGEDGFTLEHILGDYDEEERTLEKVALKEAVGELPENEKTVIFLRYYKGLTQQSAAKIMKISQVQVSRLEKRAVNKLRKMLE